MTLPTKAAEIAASLSKSRAECLNYYAGADDVHPKDRVIPASAGWNSRQLNWALDADLLCVGAHGWHVLSPLGQAVAEHLGREP